MIRPADYEAAHAETVEDAIEQEQAEQRRVKELREKLHWLLEHVSDELKPAVERVRELAK